MLNCLSSIKATIDDLDKVEQVVKLLVMVNAAPGFERHFAIGNGARPAGGVIRRSGPPRPVGSGMAGLPLQACVEVEMIVGVSN